MGYLQNNGWTDFAPFDTSPGRLLNQLWLVFLFEEGDIIYIPPKKTSVKNGEHLRKNT